MAKAAPAATGSPPGPGDGNGTVSPQDATPNPGPAENRQPKEVGSRLKQYIIAPRSRPGVAPMSVDSLHAQLDSIADIKVVRRVRPSVVGTFGLGGSAAGDMIVAETTQQRGIQLQATAGPDIIFEENQPLNHLGLSPQFDMLSGSANTLPVTGTVKLEVTADDNSPSPKATVILYGSNWPLQAQTDEAGDATVEIRGTSPNGFQAMYVKPFANSWEKWVTAPALDDSQVNSVKLRALGSLQDAGFTAGAAFVGWGQRLMGLTTNSPYDGTGARIGIVDSGCDNQHPALTHVQTGVDYTNKGANDEPDTQTWNTDSIGHGTHCAGVITGNGNGSIRGFAPNAQIHIMKLFPGGYFDDLARALKYAIDNRLDVVNCSLGSPTPSEAVLQWMNLARDAGVVVVVAAGNSAPDPVQFPASVPKSALAVGAVGMQKTFPDDTYHAQTQLPGTIGVNGIFPAKFSCAGPSVQVAGPGVAIISSVPGGGYAAWDGTSMAAPHITGMIGLLAAHHPDFADRNAPRNAARVDRLVSLAVNSCTPLGIDRQRVGAGLPSIVKAMAAAAAPPQQPQIGTPAPDELQRIIATVMAQLAAQGTIPMRPGQH